MWGGLADIAKGPLGDRLAQGLQAVGDIVAPIIDDEEDEDGNYDGDKSYSEMANAMFGDVGGGVVDGGGDGGTFIGVGQYREEQPPPPAASAPLQPIPNPNPSSPPRQERSESLQLEIRQLEDQLHESNNEYKHIMRENEKNVSSLAAENASLKSWLADLESEGASVRALQENNQQLGETKRRKIAQRFVHMHIYIMLTRCVAQNRRWNRSKASSRRWRWNSWG